MNTPKKDERVKMKKLFTAAAMMALSGAAIAAPLAIATVKVMAGEGGYMAEGVVEAVKSSTIAAQVSGSVMQLTVKAGDPVKAGQLLVRIDTRLATQQAAANQAQVAAIRAELAAARQEYERKKRLYEKQYISQAALERAESAFKSTEARANAQVAQSTMANVETGLHILNAPYAGVVSEVMTEVGDMAMPDKPLLSIYDPKEMRVVANVPQSRIANLRGNAGIQVEIPGAPGTGRVINGLSMTILPTADSASHVVQVRVALPQNWQGLKPGMFARVVLPTAGEAEARRLMVPAAAIVRRSELTAVYVVGPTGNPQLRQVRLGRQQGDSIEVSAGLEAGERVALDPIAAAKAGQP